MNASFMNIRTSMKRARRGTRRSIWIDLLLYPSHTLPTAAAPVAVGVGLAIQTGVFNPLPAALGFLASWAIHVGGVFTDNHRLLAVHPTLREHPELTEAIRNGTLTLSGLRRAIVVCFVVAAASGAYLVYLAGFPVAIFGLVGALASLGYSLSPYSWTKLGIADVVFFLMFGVVAVAGTYYVQAAPLYASPLSWAIIPQALPFPAFVLGIPTGAIIADILLIDDIRDREFDAIKGWRTRPVLHGLRWTRVEFVTLMFVAYAMPFWFWMGLGYGAWVCLPVLTLPFAAGITSTICTDVTSKKLLPMSPRTALLAFAYSVLLAAGVALS